MIVVAWKTLCLLAPWLLLGALLAGLLHVLLPANWLRRRLSGPGGVWRAVALGVPLPLCSCGVIPAAIGLKKNGAGDRASIGFLISTPQTGVDSILVSASFLGWPFALFKLLLAAVTGVIGGLLARDSVERGASGRNDDTEDSKPAQPRSFLALIPHSLEIVRSIWLWLVAGVLVSSALEYWVVPSGFLQSLVASGPLPAMLLMLVISIPLYVCATASVPIAAALVAGGFPAGAALVFLIAGPATNVATIGAVSSHFGRRNLVIYLTTLVIGSVVGGLLFDGLIGATAIRETMLHHEHVGWFSQLCAAVLLVLFAVFAWRDLQRVLSRRAGERREAGDPALKLQVSGMSCSGCADKIESALRDVPGVRWSEVDVGRGLVVVGGDADADTVRSSISAVGFAVEPCER